MFNLALWKWVFQFNSRTKNVSVDTKVILNKKVPFRKHITNAYYLKQTKWDLRDYCDGKVKLENMAAC